MRALAFDFGASSGRAVIGKFDGERIELEEIHRFPNEPVEVCGTLYWDILKLYRELKQGLVKAEEAGGAESVGIDTWGVDFGLLDKNGILLSNPIHYRSPETADAEEVLQKTMSLQELYSETGIAFNKFNTLCQLNALKNAGSVAYENAECALFIPDLFSYFLTGKKVCEFSIASTSQLIYPGQCKYNQKIFDAYGLKNLFMPIVPAGTQIGYLRKEVMQELHLKTNPSVIATLGHDTASAFLSVPKESENAAFLSSGTWSLLGMELDKPILSEAARKAGYTNEGGLNGSIRFLRNIAGLWIIQECKRSWEKEGKNLSFAEIAAGAEKVSPCRFIIDPDSEEFYSPNDMPEKIIAFCKRSGGEVPKTVFEIARCVYDSLALAYRYHLSALEKLTGKKIDALHIVGGGSNNEMLNRATASALGVRVIAGPSEGTAFGNILCQFISRGVLKDVGRAREIVRNSVPIRVYDPTETDVYEQAYRRFSDVLKR